MVISCYGPDERTNRWGRIIKTDLNWEMRFGGEGRSRQEDAETSCRPGWALPRQTPSPFSSQPCGQWVSQVRNCPEAEKIFVADTMYLFDTLRCFFHV